MSDTAIRVGGLSKRYRIGKRETYRTLRSALSDSAASVLRGLTTLGQSSKNGNEPARSDPGFIWALKDVSFEIEAGEVVGVMGRNGAGKSTLLKILSRITSPTEGTATIYGRLGSLLEVGSGFNPELTGRENIYLNGATLGMRKAEIDRKFDEILAFAEVERFVDTPVKRYSSGMHMRLAFSVAAHLEPEILLIDEVLAVGDAPFQKKCLGKMGEVARGGRTVLFVSHNAAAIQSLCSRALLFDNGRLVDQGPTSKVVQNYLQTQFSNTTIPLDQRTNRSGDGSARLVSLHVESMDPDGIIRPGSCLRIMLGYKSANPVRHPHFLISIYDYMDIGLYLLDNELVGGLPELLPPAGTVTCITGPINLTPGRCVLHIELMHGDVRGDYVPYAGTFDVEADDFFGSGKLPPRDWVLCLLKHTWSLQDASTEGSASHQETQ